MSKERVCIGIPCFHSVTHEVLEDYIRFAYHLGRRNTEYDFFIAIKPKSAQHRARNAIVESAIATDCQYLFMLDDDHIIDIENTIGPGIQYDIAKVLIDHLKEDPKKGIVGGLYYQRGATCDPVIMFSNPPGYTFYQHQDISRRLQKVDVTGGGCMMIRMSVFDKIESPWFMDEMAVSAGTDIQICEKVRSAGWEVWCDTSMEVGHIMTEREVITSKNAHDVRQKASEWMNRDDIKNAPKLKGKGLYDLYAEDVVEYTGKTHEQLIEMRDYYSRVLMPTFDKNKLKEYYASLGAYQIARNYCFHTLPEMTEQGWFLMSLFNPGTVGKGLDFGCGSAPIGFELAKRGHEVDFVDVPGSKSIEFIKWRAKKYGLENCRYELSEGYDWVLLLDVIEHLHPNEAYQVLSDIVDRIKPGGSIVTNHFSNFDYNNIEHLFLDHEKLVDIFTELKMTMMPVIKSGVVVKDVRWVKA